MDTTAFRPLSIPAQWQAGNIQTREGASIHYTRTGGDLPPLILLHGVQTDGLTWFRTAQALQDQFDCIMPDARGHGQSSRVEDTFSSDLMVQDVVDLLKALNIEQPSVIGHSMGAEIAGRLAAAYPVAQLVLVDPAMRNLMATMPQFDIDSPPDWFKPIIQTMQALRTASHAEKMVIAQRLLPPGSGDWAEADFVSYVDAHGRFDLNVYRHIHGLGYLFEAANVLDAITCPVLLLTAQPMMPGADLEPGLSAYTRHIRTLQHVHFEDSGHAIMFDQLTRFVGTVRAFLRA